MTIETAEPISTSAFMKTREGVGDEHAVEADAGARRPISAARTRTTISTATASQETSRVEPSPRKTPSSSSAIAAQASTISGSAGRRSGSGRAASACARIPGEPASLVARRRAGRAGGCRRAARPLRGVDLLDEVGRPRRGSAPGTSSDRSPSTAPAASSGAKTAFSRGLRSSMPRRSSRVIVPKMTRR